MIDKFSIRNRAALIGLGTISKDYKKGIEETQKFSLVALLDINPESKARHLFGELPFYESFEKMVEKEKLDLIIISTPPKTHYDFIRKALNSNLNVIVEKPMVLKLEQAKELYDLAESKGLYLNTSYHWQNGEEIKYFNSHFSSKKISKIQIMVDDPYSSDGISINDDKLHLEGSWIDSGVNALSLVKTWLPFNSYFIKDCSVIFDKKVNQPIYSNISLIIDDVYVNIIVDWRNQKNFKRTIVTYDSKPLLINHSEQTVCYGKNKKMVFDNMNRLTRHYYNYFVDNFNYSSNFEETEKIHRILLEVKDKYEKKIN